jgi:hypothetical protein
MNQIMSAAPTTIRTMLSATDLIAWARKHAQELTLDMTTGRGEFTGTPFWIAADDPDAEPRIRARAVQALDFLQRYSGADSQWMTQGRAIWDQQGQELANKARPLGNVLRAWADQVEAGLVTVPQTEAQGVRAVASTDLMEQVRMLNEDKDVNPAAPIVLAGAALEIALRSALVELGLELPAKHSINAFTTRLRSARVLSVQDVKDVEQVSGLRNSAAHGDFEALSRERAGLMEQQVNILLRRLSEIIEPRTVPEPTSIAAEA